MRPRRHGGAVLIVTLVLLLVATLLAVSSVHDTVLETRVMAREQIYQRLFNAAEAGLRDAERRIAQAPAPLAPCGTQPCLHGMASNNTVDFSQATVYRETDASVRWYIRQIPVLSTQPLDAQYGAAASSTGTVYYEVSSQAFFPDTVPADLNSTCADPVVCLRSVVARSFIGSRP